jgi:hypothetical protein
MSGPDLPGFPGKVQASDRSEKSARTTSVKPGKRRYLLHCRNKHLAKRTGRTLELTSGPSVFNSQANRSKLAACSSPSLLQLRSTSSQAEDHRVERLTFFSFHESSWTKKKEMRRSLAARNKITASKRTRHLDVSDNAVTGQSVHDRN